MFLFKFMCFFVLFFEIGDLQITGLFLLVSFCSGFFLCWNWNACASWCVGRRWGIWGVFLRFLQVTRRQKKLKHSKAETNMSLPRIVCFFFVASVNRFNFLNYGQFFFSFRSFLPWIVEFRGQQLKMKNIYFLRFIQNYNMHANIMRSRQVTPGSHPARNTH